MEASSSTSGLPERWWDQAATVATSNSNILMGLHTKYWCEVLSFCQKAYPAFAGSHAQCNILQLQDFYQSDLSLRGARHLVDQAQKQNQDQHPGQTSLFVGMHQIWVLVDLIDAQVIMCA